MLRALKKLFKSNFLFTLGVIICVFWIIMAIIAPVVAPYDPIVQDMTMRLRPPSAVHFFGTDSFGRDIFSRVIYGGRYSLLAGCLTVIIAGAIGTFYGAIAGYVGGRVDTIMMRILIKEIIPNSISSFLIMATTDLGNQILMFSTLSFLGLGSAPPTPEWGMMVSDGAANFNKFWIAGFPGLAIFTMAMGANFIGDGLRDLLDPKLRKQF